MIEYHWFLLSFLLSATFMANFDDFQSRILWSKHVSRNIGNIPQTYQENHIITAHKRSLGQGNVFTPVCHSVHRGRGSAQPPGCRPLYPWMQTPSHLESDAPRMQTPLPLDANPLPPGIRCPPDADPPWMQTSQYSQQAGSTHPTGVHTCSQEISIAKDCQISRVLSGLNNIKLNFTTGNASFVQIWCFPLDADPLGGRPLFTVDPEPL